MTHKDMVDRAGKWLRGTGKCSVVLQELVTGAGIVPDAIGWYSATSILIECKVSRADFFRDTKKVCYFNPHEFGVGCFRYYMVPAGLVKPAEMPPGWGLLEVGPRSVKMVVKAKPFHLRRHDVEITLLLSALRRQEKK